MASSLATAIAHSLVGPVADTMSGFFALRREIYERASGIRPIGYKIGLELLCQCRIGRIVEIPIEFGVRIAGRSKLTWLQQLQFLRHVVGLYERHLVWHVAAIRLLCCIVLGSSAMYVLGHREVPVR